MCFPILYCLLMFEIDVGLSADRRDSAADIKNLVDMLF